MFIHLYVKFLRVTFSIFLLCQRNSTWTLKPEIPFFQSIINPLHLHRVHLQYVKLPCYTGGRKGGGIFYLEIETVDLVTKQIPPAYKQIETKFWMYI